MRASIKYQHLNNIKADLQNREMSALVIHRKLIEKYTELRTRVKKKNTRDEHCHYPALVYHYDVTVHDSSHCTVSHRAWYPKAAYIETRVNIF